MDLAPVCINVQLTADDIYRITVSYFARRFWLFWMFPAICLLITPVILLGPSRHRAELIANLKPALLFSCVILVIFFVLPYFSSRSNFKSQRALHDVNRYTFSDQGIAIESATSSSRSDWSTVFQVIESRDYIYIYPSKVVRWIIPKRSIPDEATLAAFRRILKAHVKGRVRLKTGAA